MRKQGKAFNMGKNNKTKRNFQEDFLFCRTIFYKRRGLLVPLPAAAKDCHAVGKFPI